MGHNRSSLLFELNDSYTHTTMKITMAILLGLVALAVARPSIFDFEGEDADHEQDGSPGEEVQGSYSWTSPEGDEFYVNHDGVAADGNQGAFGSYEEGSEE